MKKLICLLAVLTISACGMQTRQGIQSNFLNNDQPLEKDQIDVILGDTNAEAPSEDDKNNEVTLSGAVDGLPFNSSIEFTLNDVSVTLGNGAFEENVELPSAFSPQDIKMHITSAQANNTACYLKEGYQVGINGVTNIQITCVCNKGNDKNPDGSDVMVDLSLLDFGAGQTVSYGAYQVTVPDSYSVQGNVATWGSGLTVNNAAVEIKPGIHTYPLGLMQPYRDPEYEGPACNCLQDFEPIVTSSDEFIVVSANTRADRSLPSNSLRLLVKREHTYEKLVTAKFDRNYILHAWSILKTLKKEKIN